MAMSSAIAALLKPQADRGRNQFPLDNKQVYSMKAGQITPVNTFHFMPGDFLKMKVADFALTFPMQTAPFLRGRKEFSFYTVYYNAIWSLFNQYQAGRSDPKTSAFTAHNNPIQNEPRLRLSHLYMAVFQQWAYYMYDYYAWGDVSVTANWLARDVWRQQSKSSFMEIDGDFGISIDLQNTGASVSSDPVNIQVSFLPSGQTSNQSYFQDMVGQYRAYNWCRKLDMLGYGNIYPILSKYERLFLKDISTLSFTRTNGALPVPTVQYFDDLFNGCLLELYSATVNGTSKVPKWVNVYSICAYNSVFYHFFRNSYYDLNYNPRDFNLDFCSVLGGYQLTMADFTLRFLDIEYHQWKKDMFTSVLPDTQFGAVSSITLSPISGTISISGSTGDDFGRWVKRSDGTTPTLNTAVKSSGAPGGLSIDTANVQHTHQVSGTGTISGSNSFDVIALKRAEMLQDYRQTIMRAGNKTSDIFRAIYGGAPSSEHEDDVIPRFLDTFGIDIFVDPVTATADTGSSNPNGSLGDIAARGKFRGDSGIIKFNAGNNFGVLLTLAYVVPTAEYNSYMLDKHNLELTPEDHFIPQFENLGLEPIYSDELNCLKPVNQIAVLGYGPSYHHKKCAVDKVHGAFCSKYPRNASLIGTENTWYGDFNHWVSPRTDMQDRQNTQIKDFYINPSVLDNVFVQAAGADLSQDQFLCNTYFEMATTREMSKVGLINFV